MFQVLLPFSPLLIEIGLSIVFKEHFSAFKNRSGLRSTKLFDSGNLILTTWDNRVNAFIYDVIVNGCHGNYRVA